MSQQLLTFENHEYDINGLLNFHLNFEQLKFLITALVKSQKQTNQKLTDLEEKINFTDKRMDDMEKQANNQDIFLSSKYKNFYSKSSTLQADRAGKDGKVLIINYTQIYKLYRQLRIKNEKIKFSYFYFYLYQD